MKHYTIRVSIFCLLLAILMGGVAANAQALASAAASLKGTITDPSGAIVPGALVQLRGPGGEQRATTNMQGQYAFMTLRPGNYLVRVIAKGFTVNQKTAFDISAATTLDVQLTIEAESQVMNVEEEAATVNTDPSQNAGAIVLKEKELEALSDDPDELEAQLQALAGPAAGPNGGQIYIDGFTGGNLPPKSSIREVRVNGNPFSPEYDRPGFGRIEIFTKPGSDRFRGSVMLMYNNQDFNSRSPLLQQSSLPPFQQKSFSFNIGGPIKKNKASFGFDFERRDNQEDAFILATTLDANLQPMTINETMPTPNVRTNYSPRLDYTINSNNTLVVRYQHTERDTTNNGVGDFSLPSRAYDTTNSENGVQLTETMVLGPKMVNETRVQFRRTNSADIGDNSNYALNVQGAFQSGGPVIGNSGNLNKLFEATNITTRTQGRHIFKWGARVRQQWLDDTSVSNFGGTYNFFGGTGPELDANNMPIAGTSMHLEALEVYRRTELFRNMGLPPDLIRAYGGGASQFSMNAGIPLASVSQFDIGLFANDDWRLRNNITLSYGMRFESQTNIGDWSDWSPRVGLAWGLDAKGGKAARTILRAGFGIFYDRISDSVTLAAARYNGVNQLSYFLLNPNFFPAIPSPDLLAVSQQPQQLQIKYSGLQAPRTMQTSVGVERQVNNYIKVSMNYIETRGTHLQRTVNINAPIDGAYPFGDQEIRVLTETTGFSRLHQFVVSPNINYKKLFLFGFYSLGYGHDDVGGEPADPYNLRAEWAPSSIARQRAVVGTSIPLPWKISVNPFISVTSGVPYNISTGRDTNLDGFTTDRPALVSDQGSSACSGGNLVYAASFGCFNLNPATGTPVISRNYGLGPSTFILNARLMRTWSFGERKTTAGPDDMGARPPDGGGPRGGVGGGGMRGGGPPPMMGGTGGGMRGIMGGGGGNGRYNLTLSVSASNLLNHVNWAAPSGDLSSPYFGEYRNTVGGFGFGGAGSTTYNRKLDLQLRFSF